MNRKWRLYLDTSVFGGCFDAAQGWSVGLIVGRIHDIVREPVTLQPSPGRRGLLGSAIVQHHVTGVLDVAGILREARPALAQPDVGLRS